MIKPIKKKERKMLRENKKERVKGLKRKDECIIILHIYIYIYIHLKMVVVGPKKE